MYALLYAYEWTDGQVLSFVKKSGWNVKRAIFTTQAETTYVKMPWVGPKRPVTITVWLGEIKRIYREKNSKT